MRVKKIDRFRMDRPVPVRYFDDEADVEPRGYTGWTPPYWLADAQAECAVPQAAYPLALAAESVPISVPV